MRLFVHGLDVAVELACKLSLKINGFGLHHHMAMQARVKEKQVNKELALADLQWHLAANGGKACAQFQQKLRDVGDQVRLCGGRRLLKAGDGLALALPQAALDLVYHYAPTPPKGLCGLGAMQRLAKFVR